MQKRVTFEWGSKHERYMQGTMRVRLINQHFATCLWSELRYPRTGNVNIERMITFYFFQFDLKKKCSIRIFKFILNDNVLSCYRLHRRRHYLMRSMCDIYYSHILFGNLTLKSFSAKPRPNVCITTSVNGGRIRYLSVSSKINVLH